MTAFLIKSCHKFQHIYLSVHYHPDWLYISIAFSFYSHLDCCFIKDSFKFSWFWCPLLKPSVDSSDVHVINTPYINKEVAFSLKSALNWYYLEWLPMYCIIRTRTIVYAIDNEADSECQPFWCNDQANSLTHLTCFCLLLMALCMKLHVLELWMRFSVMSMYINLLF